MANIRIYVANLAAYNNGILKGEWFDLEDYSDIEQLQADIKEKVLGDDEEWAIHDFEAPFKISEYEDIEPLINFASLEEYDQAKASFMYDNGNYSALQDCIDNVDNCDYYADMTLVDLAEQFVDEGLFGKIPDAIANYIDYEAIARDLRYDYTEVTDGDFPGCYRCD